LASSQNDEADWSAVQAIAGGDQAAFARLAERETPRLLRFARSVLGSLEEAEDVVQDTLISLWENAGTWRPEARIGTWLHRVCYNRSIDRLRRRRNLVDDSVLEDMPDGGALPDRGLEEGETVRSVREALDRLPERQRAAMLLFHFQDLSQVEAAEVLGVSEAALESLLARARRQMRAHLSAGGDHV
jgi:RNA polymerase sigma-70 factor (ECF subfamily)